MPKTLKQQRFCPGKGGHCRSFLSPLEDDPHPCCSRCRGIDCSETLRCIICAELDEAGRERWHAVLKRRRNRRKKPKDARVKEELHSSGAKVGFSASKSSLSGVDYPSPSPIPPSGTVPSSIPITPVPVCVPLHSAPLPSGEAMQLVCAGV